MSAPADWQAYWYLILRQHMMSIIINIMLLNARTEHTRQYHVWLVYAKQLYHSQCGGPFMVGYAKTHAREPHMTHNNMRKYRVHSADEDGVGVQ